MTRSQQPQRSQGSVTVTVLTVLLLALLGVAALYARAPSAPRGASQDEQAEKAAAAIAPVARLEIASASAASSGPKTGEQVVSAVCGACHNTGAAGAPKVGDNAAWAPRLGQGMAGLMKSAINGKNAMPAKGGNPNLSDLELARAVVFMANKSGGNLKEPADKK